MDSEAVRDGDGGVLYEFDDPSGNYANQILLSDDETTSGSFRNNQEVLIDTSGWGSDYTPDST